MVARSHGRVAVIGSLQTVLRVPISRISYLLLVFKLLRQTYLHRSEVPLDGFPDLESCLCSPGRRLCGFADVSEPKRLKAMFCDQNVRCSSEANLGPATGFRMISRSSSFLRSSKDETWARKGVTWTNTIASSPGCYCATCHFLPSFLFLRLQ